MSEEKIVRLETALAHQERQIRDLTDAVHTQWHDIKTLKGQMARLLQKLKDVEAGLPPETDNRSAAEIAADEKPPHY